MINFFDRISLRWSIVLTFSFITLLFVCVGLLGLFDMKRLGNLTATLYKHPLQVSNAALLAQVGVIRMHRDMKDVVLAKDAFDVEHSINLVQNEEAQVYKQLDVVQKYILGQEGQGLAAIARETFADWKIIRNKVVALLEQGKRSEAVSITQGEGADHVRLLERRMSALTSYARNKADGFMENARAVQKSILYQTIAALSFLVFTLFLFTRLILHHVVGRLELLEGKLKTISQSGDLATVEVVGDNEIARLTTSFNALIVSLRRQIWLREGLNTLNEQLLKVTQLNGLDDTLSAFSRHLTASSGALFAFDAASDRNVLVAGYALPDQPDHPASFKLGEGIVGQAARDLQPILLTQVSRRQALMVSGTSCAIPRSIYAAPLIYKDELMGVVEFASMDGFDAMEQEFIKFASSAVAGALAEVKRRGQIDALYEETRTANLELERKSEELALLNQQLSGRNEELAAQSQELQAKTYDLSWLADELTEQKKALEIKQLQVEEADRLKSEFLSNMSHELRTPLNSILALSQLMLTKGPGANPEKEAEYLRVVDRNGRHLLSLINDILDLSKIEAGRLDISSNEFSADAVLAEATETMTPLAQAKGLQLTRTASYAGAMVSDRDKLLQILLNLISNAVKFTQSGKIDIELTQEGDEVVFSVADTGVGIESEDFETIFDEFRQIDGSTSRRHEGTGLGLTICRKLSRLLGGDLFVASTPGQGSTFTLRLPVVATLPRDGGLPPKDNDHAEAASNLSKTVLVVEDKERTRELIRSYLVEAGYYAITCSNGEKALKIAQNRNLHAITLDIFMPEMDGWELLRQLRASPKTEDIPVIIVSISEDHSTGMALGANGYMVKPVDRDRLLAEIQRIEKAQTVCNVLIMEDDEPVQEHLAAMLREAGYQVAAAGDGEAGLEMARKVRPQTILLDLCMPKMDGFQVLKRLREDPVLAQTPVIVLTAKDLTAEEQETLLQTSKTVISKSRGLEKILEDIKGELLAITPHRPHPACCAEKPLILVVGRDKTKANHIAARLETLRLPVSIVGDERQAVEQARENTPGFVVVDAAPPAETAWKALDALRSLPQTKHSTFVVLAPKDMLDNPKHRMASVDVRQLAFDGPADLEQLRRLILDTISAKGARPAKQEDSPTEPAPVGGEKDASLKAGGAILLVEDNEDNVFTVQAVLEDFPGKLAIAQDGETGVELAISTRPDLILMDIQLPGVSGIEATKTLKADSRTKDTPIIALTARASSSDHQELIAAGCDAVLTKPFSPQQLIDVVNRWLA